MFSTLRSGKYSTMNRAGKRGHDRRVEVMHPVGIKGNVSPRRHSGDLAKLGDASQYGRIRLKHVGRALLEQRSEAPARSLDLAGGDGNAQGH